MYRSAHIANVLCVYEHSMPPYHLRCHHYPTVFCGQVNQYALKSMLLTFMKLKSARYWHGLFNKVFHVEALEKEIDRNEQNCVMMRKRRIRLALRKQPFKPSKIYSNKRPKRLPRWRMIYRNSKRRRKISEMSSRLTLLTGRGGI